jgi:hypothetical protein
MALSHASPGRASFPSLVNQWTLLLALTHPHPALFFHVLGSYAGPCPSAENKALSTTDEVLALNPFTLRWKSDGKQDSLTSQQIQMWERLRREPYYGHCQAYESSKNRNVIYLSIPRT